MNRLFRLLQVWLRARRFLRATPPDRRPSALEEFRTPLRVMPNDLDLLRHVNNGSYLTLLDLGRLDMTWRSGSQPELSRRGWFPVVVGESITFRRSLTLGERFAIVTRVVGWDPRVLYLTQRFERRDPRADDGSSEVVAEAWIAARFLSRQGGSVPSQDVAEAYGLDPTSPPVPTTIEEWARSLGLAHRETLPDGTAEPRS